MGLGRNSRSPGSRSNVMEARTQPLCTLAEGAEATVSALMLDGMIRRRLQDIGLIAGARIRCLYRSPSGDPAAYLICGAVIALRRQDAAGVIVER